MNCSGLNCTKYFLPRMPPKAEQTKVLSLTISFGGFDAPKHPVTYSEHLSPSQKAYKDGLKYALYHGQVENLLGETVSKGH